MGKRSRSVSPDYECIARKIKKLERKLIRARRKLRDSSSSSTCSSSLSESTSQAPSRTRGAFDSPIREPLYIEGVPWAGEPRPSTSAEPVLPMPPSAPPSPLPPPLAEPSTSVVAELPSLGPADTGSAPITLDSELWEILGEDPSQTQQFGKNIQADLALRLQHIATSGLTKEVQNELLDKYLPPANCKLIDAPTLNPEVKAAVTDSIIKRDKGIELKQKKLASATSCVAEAATIMMASENKDTAIIKLLIDASKLLCDCLNADSITRRNFVLFNLKKELKDQLLATKVDKYLFSEDLAETLKAAKAISRTGTDIKLTPPVTNKQPFKKDTRPPQGNLNWRPAPPSHRHRGSQKSREPAYKRRHENSSKPSSRPAPRGRNRR